MLSFKAIFLVLVTLAIGFTASAKPRQILIWSHGIGGDKSQFGALPDMLQRNLSQNGTEVHFYVFEYATGDNILRVPDFEKQFDAFVRSKLKDLGGLRASDEITLGAYSQGGLIHLSWLFKVSQSRSPENILLVSKIRNFVTVATPFWGAQVAKLGYWIKFLSGGWGKVDPLHSFGKGQLDDMRVGSEGVFNLARQLSTAENYQHLMKLTNGIKFLQINGFVLPGKLTSLFSKETIFDDDLAVPNFSTPLNFISYFENPQSATRDVKAEDFLVTNFSAREQSAEGWHMTRAENVFGRMVERFPRFSYPSLPDVPDSCLNQIVADCSSKPAQMIYRLIKNETLDPQISIPRRYSVNLLIHFVGGRSDDGAQVTFQAAEEINSKAVVTSASGTEQTITKHITGRVDHSGQEIRKMRVWIPGYRARHLEVPVQAGKSTFIELYFR